ncbi:MAG: lysozyme inhibitor LprI family protein [Oscillatoriaceae cyanobacterium Prado104]|nr:lysozyme inhibitor LprI family protein [Oscillatoriaceae cyanobacterium Prado104]
MKKRSLFRLIISLIFLSASSSVVLGQGRSSPASEPAVCNQPQTTAQINNCAAALYRESDRRLNEVYKQVISKLNRRDRENGSITMVK